MLQQNLDRKQQFLRLWMGFSLLGWGIWRKSDVMIVIAAEKIAEGITGHCLLKGLLDHLEPVREEVVERASATGMTV